LQGSLPESVPFEVDMKTLRDPEGAEISHLLQACPLTGKEILEIGCGDGKFIRQYMNLPNRLVGIDPALPDLITAKVNQAGTKISFLQSIGEKLPFPPGVFNIVIFASSL
jgi:ubiquinone/menaquinone biosynthesis C-methylase UbiE